MKYLELSNLTEIENRMVVVRSWGRGEWELLFNGYEI